MANIEADVVRLWTTKAAFPTLSPGDKYKTTGYDPTLKLLMMKDDNTDTIASEWSDDTLQCLLAGAQDVAGVKTFTNGLKVAASQYIGVTGSGGLSFDGSDNPTIGGNLGIGGARTEGTLHVLSGSAGAVAAASNGDLAVFESSGSDGISVLGPDASTQNVILGSPSDNAGALIQWSYLGLSLNIGPAVPGAYTYIRSGNATAAITIDDSQDVTLAGDLTISGAGLKVAASAYIGVTGSGGLSFDGSDNVSLSGNLSVAGVGPHSIGTVVNGNSQCYQSGNYTSDGTGTSVRGYTLNSILTAAAGDTSFHAGMLIDAEIITQNQSEVIANVAQLRITEPSITTGSDSITNASTLLITGAPTEGSNNYAILVGDLFYVEGSGRLYTSSDIGCGDSDPTFLGDYGGIHVHRSGTTYPLIHLTSTNTGAESTDGVSIYVNSLGNFYLDNKENASMYLRTNNTDAIVINNSQDVTIAGDLTVSGAGPHAIGGAVVTSSTVSLGGNIFPTSAGGASLGSATNEFSDVYLADGAVIYGGNDQDQTITHVHNEAWAISKIYVGDSAAIISQDVAGGLYLEADDDINSVVRHRFQNDIVLHSDGRADLGAGASNLTNARASQDSVSGITRVEVEPTTTDSNDWYSFSELVDGQVLFILNISGCVDAHIDADPEATGYGGSFTVGLGGRVCVYDSTAGALIPC